MIDGEVYDGMAVLDTIVAKKIGDDADCSGCIFLGEPVCLPCVSSPYTFKETHYIWIKKEQA